MSTIGEGGMGVVYEALDRHQRRRVALKTLRAFDPAALYLFKQEFRTLADVHHPNLVRLHELVAEGDTAFFTMELVRGTDFRTYVCRPGTVAPRTVDAATTVRGGTDASRSGPTGPDLPSTPLTSPADLDRLRPALRQLVEGLHALHAEGKLHRDVKPSNVLVTHEGRVVILDFGVATEVPRTAEDLTYEGGQIFGTALYMSPEQACGEAPHPAADWYSVGVMLYEALVGALPVEGRALEVMALKALKLPVAPSARASGIPADLEELALALLDPVPERRPSGAQLLRRLAPSRAPGARATPMPPSAMTAPFFGRQPELRALREAFDSSRAGRAVTVRVRGRSGLGKSALAHYFLDELVDRGEAAVMRGRAYERESLPYKAVDGVVDVLSRHLMRSWDEEGSLTLPRDMWALARMFPVLRRVPAIARLSDRPVSDLHQLRRRGFVALRELIAVVAKRHPLVVFVDDAQWGDADSAVLLADLMVPAHAPPILLVLVEREDERSESPFFLEMHARWPSEADVRDIVVGALHADDARSLAVHLLGSATGDVLAAGDAIEREAAGNPFLIEELTRSVRSLGVVGPSIAARVEGVTVERIVHERVNGLSEEAQRLLEVTAVSGRPMPLSVLADAVRVPAIDDLLEVLEGSRFVRRGVRDGREIVEIVHDRVREILVVGLPPDTLLAHHTSLARALEASQGANPQALAVHFLGAGDRGRAARYAERAAEEAMGKLAFDQAARLLRMALDADEGDGSNALRLRRRLGDVLAWAGRAAESAHAFLEAAEQTGGNDQLELERAAAEQLLAAGHIDEGGRVLYGVLARAGVRVPISTLEMIVTLVLYKTWLRISGLRFQERTASAGEPLRDARIEALHVASLGFAMVDTILGACMQARQMVAALRAGGREQVLRAAAIYKIHLATRGGTAGRHERKLDETIRRVAEGSAPEVLTFSRGTAGVAAFLRGHWKESLSAVDAARADITGVRAGWNSHANVYAVYSLVYLGQLREARLRQGRLLAEARERGDVFTMVQLRASHPSILGLADDAPERARAEVRAAAAAWARSKYLTQNWQIMRSEAEIALYEGDGDAAYARVRLDAPALEKSFLLRVQFIRVLTDFVRARAALASLRAAGAPEAAHLARRIERERMAWSAPLAAIVRAGIASATGQRQVAVARLRDAMGGAEAADMHLYAAAARFTLGRCLGGAEGERLATEAEAWMVEQEIRAPSRMASMLVPFFGNPPSGTGA